MVCPVSNKFYFEIAPLHSWRYFRLRIKSYQRNSQGDLQDRREGIKFREMTS